MPFGKELSHLIAEQINRSVEHKTTSMNSAGSAPRSGGDDGRIAQLEANLQRLGEKFTSYLTSQKKSKRTIVDYGLTVIALHELRLAVTAGRAIFIDRDEPLDMPYTYLQLSSAGTERQIRYIYLDSTGVVLESTTDPTNIGTGYIPLAMVDVWTEATEITQDKIKDIRPRAGAEESTSNAQNTELNGNVTLYSPDTGNDSFIVSAANPAGLKVNVTSGRALVDGEMLNAEGGLLDLTSHRTIIKEFIAFSDGTIKTFNLYHKSVSNVVVYVNDVITSATVDAANGSITFAAAPIQDAKITASYTFSGNYMLVFLVEKGQTNDGKPIGIVNWKVGTNRSATEPPSLASYQHAIAKVDMSSSITAITNGIIDNSYEVKNLTQYDLQYGGKLDGSSLRVGAITGDKIAAESITGNKIVAGSIDAAQIKSGAITTDKIATGAIMIGKLDSATQSTINASYNTANTALNNAATAQTAASNAIDLAKAKGNLIKTAGWVQSDVNVNPISGFNALTASNNNIVSAKTPFENFADCWKVTDPLLHNSSGGFNTALFSINPNKTYRFATYIKRVTAGTCRNYFGCAGTLTLSGASNTNPYFWSGTNLELDKWYLLVGYVHQSDYLGTTSIGGLYETNGLLIQRITDFKSASTNTQQNMRCYQYYTTAGNPETYFYAPRVDLIDGTEPTLESFFAVSANVLTALTNASTAQTTADTALTNANTANSLLAELASDNKLTPVEKQSLKQEWDAIVSEVVLNDAQAVTFGITTQKNTYDDAYISLNTYIPPLIANLATTSDIVGTTFRTNFKTYYDARTNLLNAISLSAKTLANTAIASAGTAQTAANTAQSAANTANATINTWRHPTNTTYINGGNIWTGSITASQIAVGTISADKFESTTWGDMSQAMRFVKNIVGGEQSWKRVLSASDMTIGIKSNVVVSTDSFPSIRLDTQQHWDNGLTWDSSGKLWDIPVAASGYWESASIDYGAVTTLQAEFWVKPILTDPAVTVTVKGRYSKDNVTWTDYEIMNANSAFGYLYWVGSLESFRYFKIKVQLDTTNTSKYAILGYPEVRAANCQIGTEDITDGSITTAKLASGALVANNIAILTGSVSHGGTIPLPAGYTQDQCKWIVSFREMYFSGNVDGNDSEYCYVNSSRVVSVYGSEQRASFVANYMIIGIK